MYYQRDLRQTLQALIERDGLNPTRLAQATGISQPTISRFLDGTAATMELETVKLLARHFKVTVSQLIGETPLEDEGDLMFAYKAMQSMPPYQVRQVLRIIETLSTPPDSDTLP